jgi:hypothetical protein
MPRHRAFLRLSTRPDVKASGFLLSNTARFDEPGFSLLSELGRRAASGSTHWPQVATGPPPTGHRSRQQAAASDWNGLANQ